MRLGLYKGQHVAVKLLRRDMHGPQPGEVGTSRPACSCMTGQSVPWACSYVPCMARCTRRERLSPHGLCAALSGVSLCKCLLPCVSALQGAASQALLQEVEVLGRCDHPCIVKLLAVCLLPSRLCMVLALCETSLEALLVKQRSAGAGALLPLPKARRSRAYCVHCHVAVDAVCRGQGGVVSFGHTGCLFCSECHAQQTFAQQACRQLKSCTAPPPQVLRIAIQIARGLAYLHPHIVHR